MLVDLDLVDESSDTGFRHYRFSMSERPGCIDTICPLIYICPHCQDIWARFCMDGKWDPLSFGIPCERCPAVPRQPVPGSLLRNFSGLPWETYIDVQMIAALPPVLLARELNLHIKALEEDHGHATSNQSSASGESDPYLAGILNRPQSFTWG